jgi:hypothetical protein
MNIKTEWPDQARDFRNFLGGKLLIFLLFLIAAGIFMWFFHWLIHGL